jgi:hypothetical protein
MRTAPPVHIAGRRDPWWYGVWCVISVIALATTLVWCALLWPRDSPAQRWARACAPLATALCAMTGLRGAGSPRKWHLVWDGQQWWLETLHTPGPPQQSTSAAVAGTLRPAIDLGPWLLLRFTPSAPIDRWHKPAPAWLSLRHSAHGAHWHALRCAVYSPRAAPEPPPAQVGGTIP